MPAGYESERLKRGFEATTRMRLQTKTFVDMQHTSPRDNANYRLDPDYIKFVKREQKKKNFDFVDFLPNSLRRESLAALSGTKRNFG